MKLRFRTLAALAALASCLAGCRAVRDARRAQEEAAPAGEGAVARGKVDLSGLPLPDLVAFALTNRPSMASAAIAVEDARLALKEIAADAPLASSTPWKAAHANASLGYSESSKAAHFDDFETKTRRGDATGAISVDLLVWDFGRNDARARAQAENVLAAEQSLVKEGYSVFNEVSAAYFALLQNRALLEVAATNEVQYADHLERAESMFEQGEAQKLDVLRAKLDLARARESLVSASNDVAVSGARLMAALGVDASQGDFRSVLGDRPVWLTDVVRGFADTDESAEDAFAFARTNAPAMKVARARLRAASAQVDYAVADLKPSVSASLSLNWTDPLWYWRWGLSAAQSLFTGWRKTTAVDRAVLSLRSAESAVESEEQQLSRSIEVAVAERDNARESVRSAEESVRSALENLETVTSRYEVGDVSRVDFTDAVSAYAEAQGNRIKAFYRGQIAEAALFETTGRMPEYFSGE